MTILKRQGEATVDELAQLLDLTPVTVRHHLDILRADGLVETAAVRRRRGPGRPQYVYTLTPESADHFPQNYDRLVNELLQEIKGRLGEKAVDTIFDGIAARRQAMAPVPSNSNSLAARLHQAADYLSDQGYIADIENKDGTWYINVSNCPYHNVASEHSEICEVDLMLIQYFAGTEVICRQRIAQGAHACIYEIRNPPDA